MTVSRFDDPATPTRPPPKPPGRAAVYDRPAGADRPKSRLMFFLLLLVALAVAVGLAAYFFRDMF